VAWRYSRSWVGWSPLPPEARWTAEWGLEGYDSTQTRPSEWVFASRQKFLDSDLSLEVVPVTRNAAIIEATKDATRYDARGGRAYAHGIERATIEKMTGRRPTRVVVLDAASPAGGGEVKEGQMLLYRPIVGDSAHVAPRGALADSLDDARGAAAEHKSASPAAKSSPGRTPASSSPKPSRPGTSPHT
jgi:hypothetical protein